jgi:NAD(P)H-dependent FMN reductase
MKLTVFNGSPKPGPNNTQILIEHLAKGFKTVPGMEVEVFKLDKMPENMHAAELFAQAETVLVAFPLYTFAMPGDVKLFFEALEPYRGKCNGKKLGFLVQYGFIEAVHARPLEKHLEKLSAMLGCDYIGTISRVAAIRLPLLPNPDSGNSMRECRLLARLWLKSGRLMKPSLKLMRSQKRQKNTVAGL